MQRKALKSVHLLLYIKWGQTQYAESKSQFTEVHIDHKHQTVYKYTSKVALKHQKKHIAKHHLRQSNAHY